MKPVLLFLLGLASLCSAQDPQPKPLNATAAVLRAFDSHDIVMFGEAHGCKQEYEWLDELVGTPEFADRMDDIVVEFGNSLYQELVDGYVAGDDVTSPFTVAPMRLTSGRFRWKTQLMYLLGCAYYMEWWRTSEKLRPVPSASFPFTGSMPPRVRMPPRSGAVAIGLGDASPCRHLKAEASSH